MNKKTISCPCGFTVTTDDEEQLVKHAQLHANEVHGMNPTRDEVLAMAILAV